MSLLNEESPDHVTRIVEHPYFLFHVQKIAEERTSAYLARQAKLVATVAGVVLTVLGYFGLKEYTSVTTLAAQLRTEVEDVRERSEDLNTLLMQISERTRAADEASARALELVNAAYRNIDASHKVAESAGAAAANTSAFTQQMQLYTRSLLDDVKQTQETVASRNTELQESLRASSQRIQSLAGLEEIKNEVSRWAEEVESRRKEVVTTSEALKADQAQLSRALTFDRELAKAKTFELLLIRDRRTASITLPDFEDVSDNRARRYTLDVTATRIKDDVSFTIKVNGTVEQNFDRMTTGQSQRIAETPFAVRVDSIYHAKLAYDFVMLRIVPADYIYSATPTLQAASQK